MASEKRQLRGRGNGETDRKDLCVERQNIDIFWKKSRRAEQELVRLGKREENMTECVGETGMEKVKSC